MSDANNAEVIPAPYKITSNDQRGLVVVITGITISFVIASLVVRIYVRLRVKEWKRDDSVLALASLFCCFQASTVFVQVDNGLGLKHSDRPNLYRLGKANYAQLILYIFTLFLSKCVVVLLYMRLTVSRKHAITAWTALGASATWAVISIVLISMRCNPAEFWTLGVEECSNIALRWEIIGGLDIFTEAALFLIAIYMVFELHMAFRLKALVVFAFSMRLPVIVAAAVRIHYIHTFSTASEPTFVAVYCVVAGQFQLDFAIVANTVSCMGPFLRPFEKEPRNSYQHQHASHSYRHSYRSSDNRYQHDDNHHTYAQHAIDMESVGNGTLTSKHRYRSSIPLTTTMDIDERHLQSDFYGRETSTMRNGQAGSSAQKLESLSLHSNDSRKMIISKMTSIEHDGPDGAFRTSMTSMGSYPHSHTDV